MRRKIIGVTVGTPTSAEAIKKKLKPVTSVNGDTPDENGNVDLKGFATEQWVKDEYQPKGNYLDADKLPEAVDAALEQAKESGEFKGDPGDEGKSAYQAAVDNGFDGTEAEWLESLHGEDAAKPFFVHFVYGAQSSAVTDTPVQDIIDAYKAGRIVIATLWTDYIGHLGKVGQNNAEFLFHTWRRGEASKIFVLTLFADGTTYITPIESVSYGEAQNLTEEQKAQARANIGSISGEELEAAKPFFVTVMSDEDGNLGTDVPFEDIVNAYTSHRLVYALYEGTTLIPLGGVNEDTAVFVLNAGLATGLLSVYADGTASFETVEAGGGGEAETFVVPVTPTGDTSGTIDVPFEEIANAVSSGKFVYATIEMMNAQLPLAMFSDSDAVFYTSLPEGTIYVIARDDGTVEMIPVLAGGGAEPLIVEINTDDNGNMIASTNSIEINEAAHSGRNVYAVIDNNALTLAGTSVTSAQFELTASGFGVVTFTVDTGGSVNMTQTAFGGGSGPLIVNVTPGDDGNYVLDASFDEIVSAHDSGRLVYARAGQFQLALTARFETTVLFSCAMGAGEWDDLDGSMNMASLVVYNSGEARPFNYFLADSRDLESFVENIPGRIESALNEAKPDIVADVIAQLPIYNGEVGPE